MFHSNEFLFTAETTPDVTTDLTASAGKINDLINVADAVNVTDSPNCKTKLNSLLVASEIKKKWAGCYFAVNRKRSESNCS